MNKTNWRGNGADGPNAGDEIHGFALVERLGAGGFGEAWLVENLDRERLVLKLPANADAETLAALRKEVALYRRLRSAMDGDGSRPPIVALKQNLLDSDPPALAMEYLAGGDLLRFRKERGFAPMKFAETLPIARDILEALAFAHGEGVVHRDLSPENVLFDQAEGRWKLTDFGLGGLCVENELSLIRSGKSMGLSEGMVGKLQYMAPEQRDGGAELGPQADIYALGVVWSEMLVGGEGRGMDPDWRDAVPEQAVPFLRRCLRRDPAERFLAAELLEEIEALLAASIAPKKRGVQAPPKPAAPEGQDEPSPEAGSSAGQAAEPRKRRSKLGCLFKLALIAAVAGAVAWPKEAKRWASEAEGWAIEAKDWAADAIAQWQGSPPAPKGPKPLPAAGPQEAEKLCQRGDDHYYGRGVPLDFGRARDFYLQAAALGHAGAMNNLGVIYDHGQGVFEDDFEAVRWFRQSAQAGNPVAMKNLGIMLENGRGGARDYREAVRWYRQAAQADDIEAMKMLGDMLESARGVGLDQAEAARWYKKAAERGDSEGMKRYGYMLANGLGVRRDDAEAVRWYRQAADLGHAGAMCNLGWMFQKGLGVFQSDYEAASWYRKAANAGNDVAAFNLGVCHENGQGVPVDADAAIHWYAVAAGMGYAKAQAALERMLGKQDRERIVTLAPEPFFGGDKGLFGKGSGGK